CRHGVLDRAGNVGLWAAREVDQGFVQLGGSRRATRLLHGVARRLYRLLERFWTAYLDGALYKLPPDTSPSEMAIDLVRESFGSAMVTVGLKLGVDSLDDVVDLEPFTLGQKRIHFLSDVREVRPIATRTSPENPADNIPQGSRAHQLAVAIVEYLRNGG